MVINTHLEHASLYSREALKSTALSVFITEETLDKKGSANASLTSPSTVKITTLIF